MDGQTDRQCFDGGSFAGGQFFLFSTAGKNRKTEKEKKRETEKEKKRKREKQIMDTKEKTKKTDHGHNGQMNNNQSENCKKEKIERTTQPKNQTSKKCSLP